MSQGARPLKCTCGSCKACIHREYMRTYRVNFPRRPPKPKPTPKPTKPYDDEDRAAIRAWERITGRSSPAAHSSGAWRSLFPILEDLG